MVRQGEAQRSNGQSQDEIIVEAPKVKAEQAKELLAKIMVSVFDELFKKQIPIEVDAKICENWGENEGVCDVWAAQSRG
jgi:DNA polymerase I-like protein with 3'-5' exonuclease and polymerase domains